MVSSFRDISPKRTCTKSFSNYRSYKNYLAKDFNNRCGYTNCSDFWFGGAKTFHIDHFKPLKNHPELKTEYSNLVYCCSYANILKSDDEGLYLDPCNVDYNAHFERDFEGNIIPRKDSEEANYMYSKLKLYLKRYRIIWKLDVLLAKMDELEKVIDIIVEPSLKKKLKVHYADLAMVFRQYLKYLKSAQ